MSYGLRGNLPPADSSGSYPKKAVSIPTMSGVVHKDALSNTGEKTPNLGPVKTPKI